MRRAMIVISSHPRVQQFVCFYCAGTGYEDYPSNTKPCRVEGHKERGEEVIASTVYSFGCVDPLLTGDPSFEAKEER